MLFDARPRRQRGEHARPLAVRAEHLEIDDAFLDRERYLAFELERHGLREPAAVAERQIEDAKRYRVAGNADNTVSAVIG